MILNFKTADIKPHACSHVNSFPVLIPFFFLVNPDGTAYNEPAEPIRLLCRLHVVPDEVMAGKPVGKLVYFFGGIF